VEVGSKGVAHTRLRYFAFLKLPLVALLTGKQDILSAQNSPSRTSKMMSDGELLKKGALTS
jgi:hypothetical protein